MFAGFQEAVERPFEQRISSQSRGEVNATHRIGVPQFFHPQIEVDVVGGIGLGWTKRRIAPQFPVLYLLFGCRKQKGA
jgi:hypothetical protein